MNKEDFHELIKLHIDKEGYHLTIVSGESALPRYAYTIGFQKLFNFEIAFVGAEYYKKEDVKLIIFKLFEELNKGVYWKNINVEIGNLGSFTLSLIHTSWSKLMFLGVWDYYGINTLKILQVIPNKKNFTLDIPNMLSEYSPIKEPIWKWLTEKWSFNVPENSVIFTNIETLFGEKITEIIRWEENEWDMFTTNSEEILKKNIRVIPLGTVLGIDPTLKPALNLDIGKGIWRKKEILKWNKWN